MQRVTCRFCTRLSQQFTILKCDHVTCAQCLWSQMKASLSGGNTIRCTCGQLSTFVSKSRISSPSVTAHITRQGSPRRYQSASRPLKTETSELLKNRQQTELETENIYRLRRKSVDYGSKSSDLARELQFLSIQFQKSLDQVENNFKIVVKTIQQKYQNLVKNIRLFWLQEVVQSEPLHYLNLPKLFEKKYQKSIGHKLKHFNETLIENLMTFKSASLGSYQRLTLPSEFRDNKENQIRSENCRVEREKLLKTIEHMKEERGGGLRKVGKKVPKYKFM